MNPFDKDMREDGLQMSQPSMEFLESSAKWARFLAILGFIGIGLMVIASLFMIVAGSALSSRSYRYGGGGLMGMPFGMVGIIYLVMAVLYFFPVLYLNNFASKMLNAIVMRDQVQLESSFENLRNHYRFVGILTIVLIGLYFLMILIGVMAGASQRF